jgi:predicted acyltransferase
MSSATPIVLRKAPVTELTTPVPAARLMSLDLFRGATIAAMILVNNAGDERTTYWPLKHAEWNGWTPTDLIFPFFLFIVGVAMAYSFSSRLQRGEPRAKLLKHILVRGLILFSLGLFLNGFPNHYELDSWRIYGVLQRIAICYVIAGTLALCTTKRAWIALTAACLLGYWIIMRYVPVPGLGVPTHGIPLLDPDRNLAAWLDRRLLMGHLYDGTRDPEGVISTIPAIATTLLGLLTGDWLRSAHSHKNKLLGMFLAGVLGVLAGEVWQLRFPINKNLWTSSFVVFTAGAALITLSLCYWILDVQHWRGRWTKFFLVFGMNPIAAYVFAELIAHWIDRLSGQGGMTWQEVIYQQLFGSLANPYKASLLYAISFVLMCWLAMGWLHRKRIFLKI